MGKEDIPEKKYPLGSCKEEQERLHRQRSLYGDTLGIVFKPTDHVREYGCGPGTNLWIAEQLNRGMYLGGDIQEAQITKAKQIADGLKANHAHFILGDSLESEPMREVFDAVFARCYLVHQSNPGEHIKHMHHTLKPGGRIILIEPQDSSLFISPGHESLLNAWQAKMTYTSNHAIGSPDIARRLFTLLVQNGFESPHVVPHHVSAHGGNPERCKELLANWMTMIERTADRLVEVGLLTEFELQSARQEAAIVSRETFATLIMWKAEALRPLKSN